MDAALGGLAAVLAFVFAAVVAARWRAGRGAHYLAWTVSMTCFGLGSAALAWGAAAGWSDPVFRVYYLCGAVLNVPWLGLGNLYLLDGRRVAHAVAVAVAVFSVAGVVVVLMPSLRGPLPGAGVPEGRQLLPLTTRMFAVVGNSVGTLLVLGATVASAVRAARDKGNGPLVQGNLLIAAGVLVAAAGGSLLGLGVVADKALALVAAEALIFAGFLRAAGVALPSRSWT